MPAMPYWKLSVDTLDSGHDVDWKPEDCSTHNESERNFAAFRIESAMAGS